MIFATSCSKKGVGLAKERELVNLGAIVIDNEKSAIGPCEPSICISPTDNKKVVAGSCFGSRLLFK